MTKVYLGVHPSESFTGSLGRVLRASPEDRAMYFLVSFYFFGEYDVRAELAKRPALKVELFADSGAFSARDGKEIDFDAYAQWIVENRDLFATCAAPDVIGDPERTYARTREFIDAGLNVVPTFHMGEDPKWLKKNLELREDYVALGGVVPHTARPALVSKWLSWCFSKIPRATKVHGFGITKPRHTIAFPFYSVDSTSWASSGKYGIVNLFDREAVRFRGTYCRNRDEWLRNRGLFERYGIDRSFFGDGLGPPKYDELVRAHLISWLDYQAFLKERRHGSSEGEEDEEGGDSGASRDDVDRAV